jgi:glycosyltransferase involved in cell wall biosynthesis
VRLLILTQYYPPEIGAPQRRLSSLAEHLAGMGHAVRVLTALPNYPEGRVHEGYRGRRVVREVRNGIDVVRAWMWPTRRRGVSARLSSYLSFAVSAWVVGRSDRQPTDVVLTESPPLFLGATGAALARAHRCAFVLNVADLWPQAAVELGVVKNRTMIAAARALERSLYRRAALVTAQTEGLRRAAEAAGAIRTRLFENGVDVDVFRPGTDAGALRAQGLDGFVVGYAGLHGPSQQLDVVIEAARRVGDGAGTTFALFGDGPERERLREAARDVPAVRFLSAQPAERMPDLIAAWSAGVVTLRDLPSLESARPSKMFEVMGCGVPLVLAARGEAARIVLDADCGLVVEPGDAAGLAEAVRRLRGDPALRARLGENGRRAAERRFDRKRIAQDLAEALESIRREGRA